jgi:hypothetical protein
VRPGDVSDPFLVAGYQQRVLHVAHDAKTAVRFDLEMDRQGDGQWAVERSVVVPAGGYRFAVLPAELPGEWARLKVHGACRATAYFHYRSPRPAAAGEDAIFAALADAQSPGAYTAGLIRPAAHNRSLQWLVESVAADGQVAPAAYREVELAGTSALAFSTPAEDRADEVNKVAAIKHDFAVDDASVVVIVSGRRYRLPKGPAVFDKPFASDWPRGMRECVSERTLANFHGTFYEIPRGPDFERIKPVCSHSKLIHDFCTWRGLMVLSGTRAGAAADGQFFAGDDRRGLWFGAIDDLWRLGKPVGRGGPWRQAAVQAGKPSDPYLMTGYDRKRLALSHQAASEVKFTVEVNFDHTGFHPYERIAVPAGQTITHEFPAGYQAHWVRLTADADCTATATLVYE